MVRAYSYRLGKGVFKMPKDLFIQCKQYGVTEADIKKRYNDYRIMGLEVPFRMAALRALEDKKRRCEKHK